jgi:DNA-binding LacI/PurR family transcriptional regulator
VLIDHRVGVGAAADALLELGHRHIGLVSPPTQLRPARESGATLAERCAQVGATLRAIAGPFTVEQGVRATRELLTGDQPVTAIVSGSNQLFPGVMLAIRELGLSIPKDLSVIAIEDLPLLSALTPPVSFVTRHPRLVGESAARLMLDRLAGGEPSSETVPTAYVAAESCGPPPQRTHRAVKRRARAGALHK